MQQYSGCPFGHNNRHLSALRSGGLKEKGCLCRQSLRAILHKGIGEHLKAHHLAYREAVAHINAALLHYAACSKGDARPCVAEALPKRVVKEHLGFAVNYLGHNIGNPGIFKAQLLVEIVKIWNLLLYIKTIPILNNAVPVGACQFSEANRGNYCRCI